MSVNEALQKDPYISQPVHSITVICSFFSVLLLVLVLFYIFLFLKCPFLCNFEYFAVRYLLKWKCIVNVLLFSLLCDLLIALLLYDL